MKMKSAKKKSLRNKAKRGEKQHDVVVVKTESELEEDSRDVYTNGDGLVVKTESGLEEDTLEVYTNGDGLIIKTESELEEDSQEVNASGDGLNIQIKEEPHSQEIGEEQQHNGDSSSCSDTKPDTVASWSGVHHHQALVKDECDSDHQPHNEFTETAVKEESESWIKEERDGEEEAEEGEGICTGSSQ